MSELVWSRVKMILLKHENNTFTHHLNKLLNTSQAIKWRKSFLTRNLLMNHFIKDCEDILMLIPNNACNILFKYIKKLLVCNSTLIFPGVFSEDTNLETFAQCLVEYKPTKPSISNKSCQNVPNVHFSLGHMSIP